MHHVADLLEAYKDGELAPGPRQQVEAHVHDCPACRARLERLRRLSDLLSVYALPEALMGAETFRAQVMLRLPRRRACPERSRRESPVRYAPWAWYTVPLSLGGALVILQALLVLFSISGLLSRLAGWASADVAYLSGQVLGQVWKPALLLSWLAEWEVASGSVPALLPSLLGAGLTASLYLVAVLVFVLYAGWVGALWRAARPDRA